MNQQKMTFLFEIGTEKSEQAYQATKLFTLCAMMVSKGMDLTLIIPFMEGMAYSWEE
ncbi:hypothetical protein [Chitinophaga defluvii]|uniref:Uncharacterized protein n=1 Tax=Chitinophaga defluvii TaxID=3163343 RepID=A0ABV2TC90_9BACT